MIQGYVKRIVAGRNFGFIAGQDGRDFFFYGQAVCGGVKLSTDDEVEFDVLEDRKGPKALNIVPLHFKREDVA